MWKSHHVFSFQRAHFYPRPAVLVPAPRPGDVPRRVGVMVSGRARAPSMVHLLLHGMLRIVLFAAAPSRPVVMTTALAVTPSRTSGYCTRPAGTTAAAPSAGIGGWGSMPTVGCSIAVLKDTGYFNRCSDFETKYFI